MVALVEAWRVFKAELVGVRCVVANIFWLEENGRSFRDGSRKDRARMDGPVEINEHS